jgi:hypothetical protein
MIRAARPLVGHYIVNRLKGFSVLAVLAGELADTASKTDA